LSNFVAGRICLPLQPRLIRDIESLLADVSAEANFEDEMQNATVDRLDHQADFSRRQVKIT
jgi:hypothetical protein